MPVNTPVRIVVVEDNFPDVMLVGESLQSLSIEHELIHYRDGAEAIKQLCQSDLESPPDVIVLDLNMPKVGGLEVLRSIKKSQDLSAIPVAVLTSSLSPDERAEAQRLGADRFLRKPVDLYDYLNQVGFMLQELILLGHSRTKTVAM